MLDRNAMALRLADIPRLMCGPHDDRSEGACAMEAASYAAGAPWSDRPACVSPRIAWVMRRWNDDLPPSWGRDRLLRPLILDTIGTRSTPNVERRRTMMMADWIVRHAPTVWLRMAGMDGAASAVAGLDEVTGRKSLVAAKSALEAVTRDLHPLTLELTRVLESSGAGRDMGYRLQRVAGAADRVVGWDAVRVVVSSDGLAEAWADTSHARMIIMAAAWEASGRSRTTDVPAILAALRPTIEELQKSAQQLILRMCAA